MIVDFFIEINPDRSSLSYSDIDFSMLNKLAKTYDSSPYIRTHLVDIRKFIHNIHEFELFHKMLTSSHTAFLRGYKNMESFLHLIYKIIKYNILPTLDIKNNNSYIYKIKKQFYKMNEDIDYIFNDIFKNVYLLFEIFIKIIDDIDSNNYDYDDLPLNILQQIEYFYNKLYGDKNNYDIIMDFHLIFMDLYVIGRMLKQNNTFSVFYGGSHHCDDISKLLIKYKNFNLDISKTKTNIFKPFDYNFDNLI